MKRADAVLVLLAWSSLAQSMAAEHVEAPEDAFLEYLGAWDEAWEQACEPDGYLPGDAACEQTDDDERDDET